MKRFIFLFILIVAAGAGAALFFLGGEEDAAGPSPEIAAMTSKAEAGDPNAAFALAQKLRTGEGVEKDIARAVSWLTRAGEKGHVAAQSALGRIFETGEGGMPKDPARALKWYRLAAQLGHDADAEFAIGRAYFLGHGVPQDYAEAFIWYEKAASRGHPVAQHLMGAMYEEGWAVDRDYIAAYKWYTLAIPGRTRAIAIDPLYDPARARDRLAVKMNKYQIGRGEKDAREWRSRP